MSCRREVLEISLQVFSKCENVKAIPIIITMVIKVMKHSLKETSPSLIPGKMFLLDLL